jgi:CRP-like cAMP-binding protein
MPGPPGPAVLRDHPLLSALDADARHRIVSLFRRSAFGEDRRIFEEGDPADQLWFVESGQVKIVKTSASGHENIMEVIMPGEPFGGAVMLLPANPAAAVAMVESVTLSLPQEIWRSALRDHPELSLRLVAILGERLLGAMKHRSVSTERVEVRIATIIQKLCTKTGREAQGGLRIGIPLSRQDLADMAGTTIETAIRVMSRFRKEGIATTDAEGYITVLDPQALAEVVLA